MVVVSLVVIALALVSVVAGVGIIIVGVIVMFGIGGIVGEEGWAELSMFWCAC